ncbi:glycoside hydrolase family 3 N-terminal domain-containing protein [Sinorhizobium meliloti]|uniref:glycoside hydrolase family 3 N-terminal domain-containing protein n=1 Tax=Rhizobium meliloti TaxID=382 RepID=UPI000FD6D635|nr:glycoside hydrolase family 3 N-terminal domain-containing protein [Sinorhizobium meliloti]RVH51396.1 glycoside hydrolase [Sinorhizobium meliloti]
MSELLRLAYSTLFPVTTQLALSPELTRFLSEGGRAILFGEDGAEYATGVMRPDRVIEETAEKWRTVTRNVRELAGNALVALDADISAVHRLHRLTAPLPTRNEAHGIGLDEFERRIEAMARDARELGVNLLLSPTADVVAGQNPWLAGRTLADDIDGASRLVSAYVRGVKRAGIASTLKHFPGNPVITGSPATEVAHVPLTMSALRPYLAPFKAGIDAGADAVFLSPALFDALSPPKSGSTSPELIRLLRKELAFAGLVITCDLDHRSTMVDKDLGEVVVEALEAGADLLVLSPAASPHLDVLARQIERAVGEGRLPLERLKAASAAVDRASV